MSRPMLKQFSYKFVVFGFVMLARGRCSCGFWFRTGSLWCTKKPFGNTLKRNYRERSGTLFCFQHHLFECVLMNLLIQGLIMMHEMEVFGKIPYREITEKEVAVCSASDITYLNVSWWIWKSRAIKSAASSMFDCSAYAVCDKVIYVCWSARSTGYRIFGTQN